MGILCRLKFNQAAPQERTCSHSGAAGLGVKVFFLLCVAVAGLYGAATAARKILFIQTVPACIGLALLLLA